MNSRPARYLVNGAVLGCGVIAVLPLLWMLSVSLMAPGTANALPAPLLPTPSPSCASLAASGCSRR